MTGTPLSLMLVELGGQRFAVPLECVAGVAETASVTSLPFSPPGLEGLVTALGQIVPQIATGRVLGLPQASGGMLLVVSDLDGPMALRIDRVVTLIQCEPDTLISHASPFGAMSLIHDADQVPILDVSRLAADTAVTLAPSGQALLAMDAPVAPVAEPPEDTAIQAFLRLVIGGEPYALALEAAGDLVVPPTLRRMPGAPAWVGGLFEYRGQPFLALDTARLLGGEGSAHDTVGVLVSHGDIQVALLVSRAAGIERVGHDMLHEMALPMAGIDRYFVDQESMIVGVISVDSLLASVADTVRDIAPRPVSVETVAPETSDRPSRRVLTIQVLDQSFGLPLERVERIEPSVSLSPLPFDGGGFHGVADVGDAVIPVLDLRRGLGAGSGQGGICVLVRLDGAMAGLVVDHVLRIEEVPEDALDLVPEATHLPVGYVAKLGGRIISVLAIDRLLPPLP